MSPDFDLLSNAVERLERQNANFKKIGLTAVVLITAALLLGQSQAIRTVEAERFMLKGADGSVRAKLEANDGSTQFVFYNTAGKPRVTMRLAPDDEALEMRDDSGRLLALVSATTRQTLLSTPTSATIAVLGNAGGPGVILNATPDVAIARVGDAGGHSVWEASSSLVKKAH